MKEFITSFCSENLKIFDLEIQEFDDDIINLYVKKDANQYKIVANLVTIKKMKITLKELECLLFHEKGHYELRHLEIENTFLVNSLLAFLLLLVFCLCLILKIFISINSLFVLTPFILGLYLVYSNLQYLKNMREAEMQADKYACIYCSKEDFILMLYKMEEFYAQYQKKNKYKLLYLLETHPSTEKRIKALSNYSSIY